MSLTTLHMSLFDWTSLRQHCHRSFATTGAPETGVLAVLGLSGGSSRRFLVAKMLWPGPLDLKVAHNQQVVFDAGYLRRAHLFMREKRLAGIAVFHTHPHADQAVSFSRYDDQQEPLLVRNLQDIHADTRVVSVVMGRASACGRWWDTGARIAAPMDQLIAVGGTLERLSLLGTPAASPSPVAAFDRGLALTGVGALARLRDMRVAVAGGSGTGSLVCELLARAGCRDIVVIDDDIVKTENLNRILHATTADVEAKRPKVSVIKSAIERLGLDCRVQPIQGNVVDQTVLGVLRSADVIVGCVDKAMPRHVLSQFAMQHLVPYIDVGTEIGADGKGIVALNSRVNLVAPGRPCLACTGLVTPRQLLHETLTSAERGRVIAQGYSQDFVLAQPAVMDLNMRAASLGVLVLRHLLQPFLLEPLPVTVSENLITYTTLPIAEARAASVTCPICRANEHVGWGEQGPTLGLSSDQLAAIS